MEEMWQHNYHVESQERIYNIQGVNLKWTILAI